MKVKLLGAGIWARGLCSFADLQQAVADGQLSAQSDFVTPKPEAIPPRERRRAGLMINLAVTVAHQACEHAGVDKSLVPSVFVSSMGDTDITDYMCRKLAQPEKLLSPTKFHNSVHNAPSGYWTISAENRAPSTFVGGYDHSFGAGLLEAASQVAAGGVPVLLVACDIANQQPFLDVSPVTETLGMALVIGPDQQEDDSSGLGLTLELALGPHPADGIMPADTGIETPDLAALAQANDCGAGLGLLEQAARICGGERHEASVVLPASTGSALHMALGV